jgi:hypothetical protein
VEEEDKTPWLCGFTSMYHYKGLRTYLLHSTKKTNVQLHQDKLYGRQYQKKKETTKIRQTKKFHQNILDEKRKHAIDNCKEFQYSSGMSDPFKEDAWRNQ